MNGEYFGGIIRQDQIIDNKVVGKNKKLLISDFDEFMPNSNPIVSLEGCLQPIQDVIDI
jgi:hypothetical protein